MTYIIVELIRGIDNREYYWVIGDITTTQTIWSMHNFRNFDFILCDKNVV